MGGTGIWGDTRERAQPCIKPRQEIRQVTYRWELLYPKYGVARRKTVLGRRDGGKQLRDRPIGTKAQERGETAMGCSEAGEGNALNEEKTFCGQESRGH